MKNLFLILLAAALAAGCCTDLDCREPTFHFLFHGFSPAELRPVKVVRLTQGSQIKIDSVEVMPDTLSTVEMVARTNYPVEGGVRFLVITRRDTFRVSDILTQSHDCQDCFLLKAKTYAQLSGYTLQDSAMTAQDIHIMK